MLRVALAFIPPILVFAGSVLANSFQPTILGLPFFLFWIILSVVLTSAVMWAIYALDPINRDGHAEDAS